MKNIKIEIPKGYEIDKEKSTFENIVFKEINISPNSWSGLSVIIGFYVDATSYIQGISEEAEFSATPENENVFKTEEQAEASIALAQLSQLRDVYRQGWEPNWCNKSSGKYCIYFHLDSLSIMTFIFGSHFLSFQDRKTAELFLKNFRDLIEKAKPLMS